MLHHFFQASVFPICLLVNLSGRPNMWRMFVVKTSSETEARTRTRVRRRESKSFELLWQQSELLSRSDESESDLSSYEGTGLSFLLASTYSYAYFLMKMKIKLLLVKNTVNVSVFTKTIKLCISQTLITSCTFFIKSFLIKQSFANCWENKLLVSNKLFKSKMCMIFTHLFLTKVFMNCYNIFLSQP